MPIRQVGSKAFVLRKDRSIERSKEQESRDQIRDIRRDLVVADVASLPGCRPCRRFWNAVEVAQKTQPIKLSELMKGVQWKGERRRDAVMIR